MAMTKSERPLGLRSPQFVGKKRHRLDTPRTLLFNFVTGGMSVCVDLREEVHAFASSGGGRFDEKTGRAEHVGEGCMASDA